MPETLGERIGKIFLEVLKIKGVDKYILIQDNGKNSCWITKSKNFGGLYDLIIKKHFLI